MDDADVTALLAPRAGYPYVGCPYPGTWQEAPFRERTVDGVRYAVVAVDPGLGALGVRRDDGSLWDLSDGDEPPHLVNSDLASFTAFARAFEEAADEAERYEGSEEDADEEADEEAEDAGDALTEALLERFAAIDAAAVADENSFWSVAAEELGYGMDA
ncbi:SUKH-4 family immunity protein [Streptomyces sp. LE64]|uniref:SUKH-4 family immunity protein n=1 Tax=Streptomyces sp. LE64 TaxID=3448653 RepID=UPI004042816F